VLQKGNTKPAIVVEKGQHLGFVNCVLAIAADLDIRRQKSPHCDVRLPAKIRASIV